MGLTTKLERIARSTATKMEMRDVPVVKAAVEKEIAEQVKFQTNEEGPLQSPVTIGSVLACGTAILTIAGLFTDNNPNGWEDYSPHLLVVGGTIFALWGRWVAKKPLFSGWFGK